MDGHDTRFPRLIARSSRRDALRAGAGGLAAALGTAEVGRAAQGATPAAGEPVKYLFIQSFASGTLTPTEEASDSYDLALLGGDRAHHLLRGSTEPRRRRGPHRRGGDDDRL